jgi:hypothetical protein
VDNFLFKGYLTDEAATSSDHRQPKHRHPGGQEGGHGGRTVSLPGLPIAALWVVGPDFRFTADKFGHVGPVVRDHAIQVSRRFGYDPAS